MIKKTVKEKISAGLDIGTEKIKMVKLKFNQEGAELCGFALEPTPAAIELGGVLKKIKDSSGLGALNISFSGPSTVIRYVNFPKMDREDLRRSLRFEAQKHIPFSIDEINLDSFILKDDLPDSRMLVLLAALKKDAASQRLKLIEETGLKVNLADIDSLALINAFNFNFPAAGNPQQKVVALLNVGASISSLNILDEGIPRLSRDIHIAGNNFTQKVADLLGINFKEADKIKINPPADKANTAIESVLASLATEVRISFDYYESQNASNVAKIFLSGGSSRLAGFKDMLVDSLGIEAEYWDPFSKIKLDPHLDAQELKSAAGQFGIAIGLALRQ